MKCMASRVATAAGGPDDVSDIRLLLQHLSITNVAGALEVVTRYYPAARVPPRTQYLLEEILESEDASQ
jgi:hypothetical protein